MLYEFIALNREEIIRRCRVKVAARPIPPPTAAEVDHGVSLFLDQLVDARRLGQASSALMSHTALLHGHNQRDEATRGISVIAVRSAFLRHAVEVEEEDEDDDDDDEVGARAAQQQHAPVGLRVSALHAQAGSAWAKGVHPGPFAPGAYCFTNVMLPDRTKAQLTVA